MVDPTGLDSWWVDDLYSAYDRIASYMTQQMMDNARGFAPGRFSFNPLRATQTAAAIALLTLLVQTGGPWDHKVMLRQAFGAGSHQSIWTPIRGDARSEMLRFDVWSNIHFGYVGAAHGFPAGLLQFGANPPWQKPQPWDRISIGIGIALWDSYGYNLTGGRVQRAILRKMPMYRIYRGGFRPVVLRGRQTLVIR
jgi:hypothetical protein